MFAAPTTIERLYLNQRLYLSGAAGTGKTTYALDYMRRVLESGVFPDRLLILVPQITLMRPYQSAIHAMDIAGGRVQLSTVPGYAEEQIRTYWPLIAAPMGFGDPDRPPLFLNIETTQYFMARLALPLIEQGKFEGVSLPVPRVISQVIDNLNRGAILNMSQDQVTARLKTAWGDRDTARIPVYDTAQGLADSFRADCLQNNRLDYSLTVETFRRIIRELPDVAARIRANVEYLIADNVEEHPPSSHEFITWLLDSVKGALIVQDQDAGFRLFLGADPDNAESLADQCDERIDATEFVSPSPDLVALGEAFKQTSIAPRFVTDIEPSDIGDPLGAMDYEVKRFYPQMLDWIADRVIALVAEGVSPREIVICAPYLNDSLRFTLLDRLQSAGIPALTHRPSRALRDEPLTRALLTLVLLAHPQWAKDDPPPVDVAEMFGQVLSDCDPVRARVLTRAVYTVLSNPLTPASALRADDLNRISFALAENYDTLRRWVADYRSGIEQDGVAPLDHFLSRLFSEVLAQPGFGLHQDLEAGRITNQLIASAERFRRTLYPDPDSDWERAGREYLDLINQRLLAALWPQSWAEETADAVFIAPAFTFLMRGRSVQHQFWVDLGSEAWGQRLEQPLTHPYVLSASYPEDEIWTEAMEEDAGEAIAYQVALGLLRRCTVHVHFGISELSESGFESRGRLLRSLQEILRRYVPVEANSQPDIQSDDDL